MLTAEPLLQNDEFCLDNLLSMDADAYSEIMAFVKPPDFFEVDFTMGSEWSEQCSPAHSGFSSPCQYPQLEDGIPDVDVQLLLPSSPFEIGTPNYVSSNHTRFTTKEKPMADAAFPQL
jgi:hypothetical protein